MSLKSLRLSRKKAAHQRKVKKRARAARKRAEIAKKKKMINIILPTIQRIVIMDLTPDFSEGSNIMIASPTMEEFYKSKSPQLLNDEPLARTVSSQLYDEMSALISEEGMNHAGKVHRIMTQVYDSLSLKEPVLPGPEITLGLFGEAFACTAMKCVCGGELKLVESSHIRFEAPMCDVGCSMCGKFYEVKTCFKDQTNDTGQPGFLFNPKSITALVSEKDGLCRDYAGVFLVWNIHRGYFNAFRANLRETNMNPTMDIPHAYVEFFDRESTFKTYYENMHQILAYSEVSESVKLCLFKE